jgi:hypothetical protein
MMLFRLTIHKSASPILPLSFLLLVLTSLRSRRHSRLGTRTRTGITAIQDGSDRGSQSGSSFLHLFLIRFFRPLNPLLLIQGYADKIMEHRLEADTYSTASPVLQTSPNAGNGGGNNGGLSPEIVRAIDSLWHDPIIPSVLDRQSEFYLMDSAS